MDYPKSVPGVGLVGGKFVDENTATGQQGSLIPSAWGNAVTEEIVNVIKDAGDEPIEADQTQLKKAIRKIVTLVWPKASDAELASGVVDDKVVTPKKLRMGFSISLGTSGYVAFPTWLGGIVFQWIAEQSFGTSGDAEMTVTHPIVFPAACLYRGVTPYNNSSPSGTDSVLCWYRTAGSERGKTVVRCRNSFPSTTGFCLFLIGY